MYFIFGLKILGKFKTTNELKNYYLKYILSNIIQELTHGV